MNKILLILILVILIVAGALALFLVFQPFGERLPEPSGPFALGELLISEVKYSVDGSGPKFVELQVVDSSGLNLDGWYLTTLDGDKIELPSVIGLRDFVYITLVFGPGEDDLDASDGTAVIYVEGKEEVLDENGDEVALYDPNNNLRDYMRYKGGNGDPVLGGWSEDDPGPVAEPGKSVQLLGDDLNSSANWISSQPSGGLPNVMEFTIDEEISIVVHNGRHNVTRVEKLRGLSLEFTPKPGISLNKTQREKLRKIFENAWNFLKKEGFNPPQTAADGKIHVTVGRAPSTQRARGGTYANGTIELDLSGDEIIDQQIITHEFMHLVQARSETDGRGKYMRWHPNEYGMFFDEGYAEYFGYKKLAEEKKLGWRNVLDRFEKKGLGGLGAFQTDINVFTGWPEEGWGRYTSAFLFIKMIADNFGQHVLVEMYRGIRNYGNWSSKDAQDSIGIERMNRFLEYEMTLFKDDIPYTSFTQLYYKWIQENYLDKEFGGDKMYKGIEFQARAYEVTYRGGRLVIDRDLPSQELNGTTFPPARPPGNPTDRADLSEWGVDYLRIKVETDKCFKITFDGDDRGRFFVKAIQIMEKGGRRFYEEEVMALNQDRQQGVIVKQDPKEKGLKEVVLVMARIGRPLGDSLGGRLPYTVIIEPVKKSPPKPAPGYNLSAYIYVKNWTVIEWWTAKPKNETWITLDGYKLSRSRVTIEQGQITSNEIETYLYEKEKPKRLEKFEFKCPAAPKGFELKGWVLVKNYQVVEMHGKTTPSAAGFEYIESKTVVKEGVVREDWVLGCIYEPIKRPLPQKKAEKFDCPPPKPGYELVGYSHVKDFVLVEAWGEQTPSDQGYIYVDSVTEVKDYVAVSDEIKACVYEPIGWKKPDLTVEIMLEAPAPKVGEPIPVTVIVKNVGESATRDGTLMKLYADGKRVAEKKIPAGLKVGEEVKFDQELVFTEPGSHEIKAEVDTLDWIVETNEMNNVDTVTILVTGLPDLTIELVSGRYQVFATETVKYTFLVKNVGEDYAYNFTVSFMCRGEYASCIPSPQSLTISSLGPGEEKALEVNVFFPSDGIYYLEVLVDSEEAVTEKDEENNYLAFMISAFPPPLPDLTIDLSGPHTVTAGESATYTLRVRNIGGSSAHNFTIKFTCGEYVSCNPPSKSWLIQSLEPGGETVLEIEVTFPSAGEYRLTAVVDPDNVVEEEDEGNNHDSVLVLAAPPPLPDIAIQQVAYEITIQYVGEVATSYIYANMTIVNLGVDVDQSFKCKITIDGFTVGEVTVPGLKSGKSYFIEMQATLPIDVRGMKVKYIADSENVIEESNENNNVGELLIEMD